MKSTGQQVALEDFPAAPSTLSLRSCPLLLQEGLPASRSFGKFYPSFYKLFRIYTKIMKQLFLEYSPYARHRAAYCNVFSHLILTAALRSTEAASPNFKDKQREAQEVK